MRLMRVGPAAWPIHGKPVNVLSRCMWPSTSPGKIRSPRISSAGAVFDSEAAPSPMAAILPPAMPISTSRPSASRQLVRNASTLIIPIPYERFCVCGMLKARNDRSITAGSSPRAMNTRCERRSSLGHPSRCRGVCTKCCTACTATGATVSATLRMPFTRNNASPWR